MSSLPSSIPTESNVVSDTQTDSGKNVLSSAVSALSSAISSAISSATRSSSVSSLTESNTDTRSSNDTKINTAPTNANSVMSAYEAEMNKRNEQDMVWSVANNTWLPESEKLKMYQGVVNKSKNLSGLEYKKKLLEQIHPGNPADQGNFIKCPSDIYKGPFFYEEDRYTFIYGAGTDRNIRDNCNNELFKQINGTEITYGMMKRAEGNTWLNGMIVYNKNSIVQREPDNNFGQPGFLRGAYFYTNLAVEVMNRYIIPKLIKEVNENKINPKDGYVRSSKIITETYRKVYTEKMNMLNQNNIEHINECTLFEDAPRAEKLLTQGSAGAVDSEAIKNLTKIIESKDIRIDALEKKVESLSSKLNLVLTKMNELEEMFLDVSIKVNKQ